jgi:Transposase DDE domain
MVDATVRALEQIGVTELPEVVVADAGYWPQVQMEHIVCRGVKLLIPPDSRKRKGTRPGWGGGAYAFMRRVLQTDAGRELYRKRQAMIEPVFGHTKVNRRIDRFQRRGRAACRPEWRPITATHNLLKLHKPQLAPAAA